MDMCQRPLHFCLGDDYIAIFQVALWIVVKQEFIATHRPKFRVRSHISKSEASTTQPRIASINVGEIAAVILKSHCQVISAVDGSRAIKQFSDSAPNNLLSQGETKAGESIRIKERPYADDVKSEKLKMRRELGMSSSSPSAE